MKFKTHSGAKKRFSARAGGKIKRGQSGKRHLLNSKSSKRKRHLGDRLYVHSANTYQVRRQLGV